MKISVHTDAARYRWLRENISQMRIVSESTNASKAGEKVAKWIEFNPYYTMNADSFDAVVDAAREEQKQRAQQNLFAPAIRRRQTSTLARLKFM